MFKRVVTLFLVLFMVLVNMVSANEFYDLSDTDSCSVAVTELVKLGVVEGFPDGSYKPEQTVTRAEFCQMILDFTWDIEKGEIQSFPDVDENDWFYEGVTEANAKQLIKGNDEGLFNPNGMIKREDAVLIIYRLLALKEECPLAHRFFSDRKDVSEYAKVAVEALGSVDIIKGDENNNFSPKDYLTRADAAEFLYSAFVSR